MSHAILLLWRAILSACGKQAIFWKMLSVSICFHRPLISNLSHYSRKL